ncbi:hypothetical protein PILCRDRAFT_507174 [Piloderma croceum F 1598]|uniref:Uncharacterized protein n=1 Tax=Piloderma croceum (strain F 1598) TaxID=765440 RepID=A0A0C3F9F3_PILCF|nr:hypothetical protein PILCRDRAFT_507174 [Piloderma croceum F 1598]
MADTVGSIPVVRVWADSNDQNERVWNFFSFIFLDSLPCLLSSYAFTLHHRYYYSPPPRVNIEATNQSLTSDSGPTLPQKSQLTDGYSPFRSILVTPCIYYVV